LEGEIVSLRLSIEKLVQGRTCCLQSCEKNKEISTLELQLKDQDAIILSLRSHVSKVQKERDQQELANIGLLARHQEDLVVSNIRLLKHSNKRRGICKRDEDSQARHCVCLNYFMG
jgi:hypothetical protein